jgi:hypothetical protein
MTHAIEQLAAERVRTCLEQARQERQARRLRALRRAARKERTAERHLIQAWRRAAELRARLESPDY